jgi:hypothetical protein
MVPDNNSDDTKTEAKKDRVEGPKRLPVEVVIEGPPESCLFNDAH